MKCVKQCSPVAMHNKYVFAIQKRELKKRCNSHPAEYINLPPIKRNVGKDVSWFYVVFVRVLHFKAIFCIKLELWFS